MAKTITLADIDHSMGHNANMAGIVPQLIFGYHEDVAVFPTEPVPAVDGQGVETPLSLEAAGALVGDVVMKPGTRAYTLDFTEDVGSFKITPVGETDGEHVEYELTIIKAKITKKMLGFMNAANNKRLFFIVTDENETSYLMGSKKRGVKLQSGGDGATTGTASGDRNQISMSFKFRAAKALVYDGDVENILLVAT